MSEVFAIVAPIFLVVGFGYAASLFRLISDEAVDGLMRFTIYFAVTCLLFRATATIDLRTALKPGILVSYYLPAFVCFASGIVLARTVFRQRPGESVSAGFTTLFANTLFIGIPVCHRAYGEAADPTVYAIVSIHAATMYTLGVVSMEASHREGSGAVAAVGKVVRSLSRNPLVIAVALGFAYNFTGLAIPSAVDDALKLLTSSALPAGMFAVGAALTRYSLGGKAVEAGVMVFLKLLIHPALAMLFAFTVFSLDSVEAKTVVMMAAIPSGLNIYIFARLYDRGAELAANVILLATATSVLTLPIWLIVLG